MNVVGLAQSSNLRILFRILEACMEQLPLDRIGIFAADAAYFERSGEAAALQDRSSTWWVKEWESVRAGLESVGDNAVLRRFEDEVGAPGIWAGLLADRRLFFGRYCKYVQHYTPRYSDAQLLAIATEAVKRVERLFEDVCPDVVLGFVPVTLHEYLILRLASARQIPVLLLRSTKLANFVSLNDRLIGLSGHIQERLNVANPSAASLEVARTYLDLTREKGAVYEGMHQVQHGHRRFRPVATLRALAASTKHEALRLASPTIRTDPHNPGYVIPAILEQVVQPTRAFRLRRFINRSGRNVRSVDGGEYCLFPLHFEPEIALQIFGRPLQNQIEVARNLALSLPAGMKLLVKEHPRAAGFRPLGYYRKLLEIPNVALAPAEHPSISLVRGAALVAVITGNIGLEAAALGKPVLVLGETEYSVLPPHLLRTCHNMYALASDIRSLLSDFRKDDAALVNYLAAIADGSIPIDLYSTLLGKRGRHSYSSAGFEQDAKRLTDYVVTRVREVSGMAIAGV